MATKRVIAHNAKVLAPFKDFSSVDWKNKLLPAKLISRCINNDFFPIVYDKYIGKIDKNYVLPENRVYVDGWLMKVWDGSNGDDTRKAIHIDGDKVYRLNQYIRMVCYG